MFHRSFVDCALTKKRKKTSSKKENAQKSNNQPAPPNDEIPSCVLPGNPCVIRAARWGSYMLQPYYPSLDRTTSDDPERNPRKSSNRQIVAQAREELQSIIDFLRTSGTIERGYAVNIFGSCFVHNWWDGYGDIDFSLTPLGNGETPDGEFVNIDIAKREEKFLLLRIAEAMKFLSPAARGNVTPILGARVPILKHTKKIQNSGEYSKKVRWPGAGLGEDSQILVRKEAAKAVRSGKLLHRPVDALAGLPSDPTKGKPLEVALRSFSIAFYSCDLPEKDADAARVAVQQAVQQKIDREMGSLRELTGSNTLSSFFTRHTAFFLWDCAHNTLHVTLHDACAGETTGSFNAVYLRCFLGLRGDKRIGPAAVRLVRHDPSEARGEILASIAAHMKHDSSEGPNADAVDVTFRFVPLSLFSIDFDISLRTLGLRNSKLLQRYFNPSVTAASDQLGPTIIKVGALFLKSWSKKAGINNSSGGMLCTYAFNIMWLHFLLYKSYREGTDGDRCRLVEYIDPCAITKDECTTKRLELQEDLYTESPNSAEALIKGDSFAISTQYVCNCHTLGSLMMEFFRYFGETFDWDNSVVTINRTAETSKKLLGWGSTADWSESAARDLSPSVPMRQKYLVAIEDPYEKGFNLGRHLNPSTFTLLKSQFLKEWMRMNTETPQDLIFKRIASMTLQAKSANQPNVNTSTEKHSDTERLLRIETMLNSLRENYYADGASNDIYSRVPPQNGIIQVATVRVPEAAVRELVTIIAQRADKHKSFIKHLVRLFAAASIEFSMKYIPDKTTITDDVTDVPEIDYIPVEAAVIKALHASITSGAFDHKRFVKNFKYLPYFRTSAIKLCAPCTSPMQNKFYSSKPFHTTRRAFSTMMGRRVPSLSAWRMPRLVRIL